MPRFARPLSLALVALVALAALAPLALAYETPLDAYWSDGFALPIPARRADAVSRWGGQPVVAGTFTSAGTTHAPNVAAFDGTWWQPLGDGPGFAAAALAAVDPSYESLTHYLLLTNTHTTPSGSSAYFPASATFDGPVHTNGMLRFAGNPTFLDRVTSVSATAGFFNGGAPVTLAADHNGSVDVPRFTWGFDRGAPAVTLPSGAVAQQWAALGMAPLFNPPSNIQIRSALGLALLNSPPPNDVYAVNASGAMTGGFYVQGDLDSLVCFVDGSGNQVYRLRQGTIQTMVTLDRASGVTVFYRKVGAGTGVYNVYLGLPGASNVIYVTGTVSHVTGPARTMPGVPGAPAIADQTPLTVAAVGDLVVQSDLTLSSYANGGSALALLSGGGSVRVGTVAPDDVAIDAFIVALGASGAFTVDAYDAGAPRGALHLRGGIVETFYGPFGTYAVNGTPITGYTRDLHHDARGVVPPAFPTVIPPTDTRGLYAVSARPAGASGLVDAVSRWDDIQWTPFAATDGDVLAAYASHDAAYVGGAFTTLAGVSAARVARFGGVAWQPLGAGLPGGTVRALSEYGGRLVAGGTLPTLGHVATWDGASWSTLGGGPGFEVRALRVTGGALYAGGGGAGGAIARWDGATWTTLAGADSVRALGARLGQPVATFGDPVGPRAWNGATWDAAPDSVRFEARAFDVLGDTLARAAGAGRIGAAPGVLFSWAGGDWSSAQEPWAPILNGLHGVATDALAFGDTLVVVGALDAAAAADHWVPLANVACWDGTRWGALGSLTAPNALGLCGSALIAGDSAGVAFWNSDHWERWGADLGAVAAVAGQSGVPHAAGLIGPGRAPRVMRVDGGDWQPLGAAFAAGDRPLALWADDGSVSSDVFVGGALTLAGATPVAGIARFDGAAWVPVGGGVTGIVETITRSGADLIVGGSLSAAGAGVVHGVARFDGAAWSPLGDNAVRVRALRAVGGALYAAGTFVAPDSSRVEGLAQWTDGAWLPLGSGVEGLALDLAAYRGALFVAGDFGWANGWPSAGVARFDGLAPQAVEPLTAPASLALAAPRPNPARGPVTLAFSLPHASRARLAVLDVAGRRVATLADGAFASGTHTVRWDRRGADGTRLAPALYLVEVEAEGRRQVRRLVLLD